VLDLLHLGRFVSANRTFLDLVDVTTLDRILDQVEQEVWGTLGMLGYEKNEPRSLERLVRRSFAQYLAQRRTRKPFARFFSSIASALLLPAFCLWCAALGAFVKRCSPAAHVAIYHYPYLKPLLAHRRDAVLVERVSFALDIDAAGFLLRSVRAFPKSIIHPRFLLSVVKWVAAYNWLVRTYSPQTVTNFIEGSFSSSIGTAFLRDNGVVHESHMHGELFGNGRIAFCEVDRFNVFGPYWERLLVQSRCKGVIRIVSAGHYAALKQIRDVEGSESILLVHSRALSHGSHAHKNLINLLSAMPEGSHLTVRLHPNERGEGVRYYSELLKDLESAGSSVIVRLDEHQDQPLITAIRCARVVVGPPSAALTEAWVAKRRIIYLSWRSDLEERYNHSPNVLSMDTAVSRGQLLQFLRTSAVDDETERDRVNQVAS
jgi:hypothetical protein